LQTRFVVVSELQYYEFAPPFQPLISKRQQTLVTEGRAHVFFWVA
jgi:hypothetical protein